MTENTNYRRFIDMIFESRAKEEVDFSIRDIITKILDYEIDSETSTIIKENTPLEIMNHYLNNPKFRDFFILTENEVVEMYTNYIKNYTGVYSFIPYIMSITDYGDEKYNCIAEVMVRGYIERRCDSSDIMYKPVPCDLQTFAYSLIRLLGELTIDIFYDLTVAYAVLKIDKFISKKYKNKIDCDHEHLSNMVESLNEDYDTEQGLSIRKQLLATDLSEMEINEFLLITAKSVELAFEELSMKEKMYIINAFKDNLLFYNNKIKSKIEWMFRYVEYKKNEYTYVVDPFGKKFSAKYNFF